MFFSLQEKNISRDDKPLAPRYALFAEADAGVRAARKFLQQSGCDKLLGAAIMLQFSSSNPFLSSPARTFANIT